MRTPFFSLNLQLLQNVFIFLFITFFWNYIYFNLQAWIFPFFHYLINFNFIIYAYKKVWKSFLWCGTQIWSTEIINHINPSQWKTNLFKKCLLTHLLGFHFDISQICKCVMITILPRMSLQGSMGNKHFFETKLDYNIFKKNPN
jgi:hypothetical protein